MSFWTIPISYLLWMKAKIMDAYLGMLTWSPSGTYTIAKYHSWYTQYLYIMVAFLRNLWTEFPSGYSSLPTAVTAVMCSFTHILISICCFKKAISLQDGHSEWGAMKSQAI